MNDIDSRLGFRGSLQRSSLGVLYAASSFSIVAASFLVFDPSRLVG
jgi:hypothetical protein